MNQLFSFRRSLVLTACMAGLLNATCSPSLRGQTPEPNASKGGIEAHAAQPLSSREEVDLWRTSSLDRAYKLKYTPVPQDANELLTALRNMLEPITKIFLVPSTSTIMVHAPEQEQARVVRMLSILDQPKPRYRLTYTLTELDGTRKVGVQRFSMVVLSGQRSQMKQGSRLPTITSSGGMTQFNYLDVGLNFDATVQEVQNGGVLKERIEYSSIAPDSTSPASSNPVVRQTQLEGTTSLTLGKPQLVGSLDVPSSTHHFDVEVVMDQVN